MLSGWLACSSIRRCLFCFRNVVVVAPVTAVPSVRRGGDRRSVPSLLCVRWDAVGSMKPSPQATTGSIELSVSSWDEVWVVSGDVRDTLGSINAVAPGVLMVDSTLIRKSPGRGIGLVLIKFDFTFRVLPSPPSNKGSGAVAFAGMVLLNGTSAAELSVSSIGFGNGNRYLR